MLLFPDAPPTLLNVACVDLGQLGIPEKQILLGTDVNVNLNQKDGSTKRR